MRAVRADGPACALTAAIPDVHTEAPVNSYAFPIASRLEPANRVVGARRGPTRRSGRRDDRGVGRSLRGDRIVCVRRFPGVW